MFACLIVVLALVYINYINSILTRHQFPWVVMEERRTNVQRKTVKGQRRVFHGKLYFLKYIKLEKGLTHKRYSTYEDLVILPLGLAWRQDKLAHNLHSLQTQRYLNSRLFGI